MAAQSLRFPDDSGDAGCARLRELMIQQLSSVELRAEIVAFFHDAIARETLCTAEQHVCTLRFCIWLRQYSPGTPFVSVYLNLRPGSAAPVPVAIL